MNEIRDFIYGDTGFSGFTMRDSGNVVNNRYPVTKCEKSVHCDLIQVAHIFIDAVT